MEDQVSDLPVSILHRILKFLPVKDAIRTSVLSKQWNSIRKSYPILEFKLPARIMDMPVDAPEFKDRNGEFLNSVDSSLQNFVQSELCLKRIGFHVFYVDKDAVSLVNSWLPLALHNGVSDLTFFFGNPDPQSKPEEYDYYPFPETTFSVNSELLRGSSEFFFLQKLELAKVFLSDSMVCDIIQNCPNLSDLSLLDVSLCGTFCISKHANLACLTITVSCCSEEFKCIIVDVLSLQRFSLRLYYQCEMIDLTSCSNLRELKLCNNPISDASFNMHISSVPLLEVLDISNCDELKIIKISLHRLKYLRIHDCMRLSSIEIDAPMLSKFVSIQPYGFLTELVLPDVIPASMYLSYSSYTANFRFSSSWFFRIREYLTVPFKGIIFSFYSIDEFDPEELSFDHDDLREAVIPPPVEVDCLDLSDVHVKHSYHLETLLDGLLWSCHPKMACVKVSPTRFRYKENWIKIEALCKMLNESECRLCCNLPRCKCWRYRLKAVKIESSKEIKFHDLNFQSVKDHYMSNPEDDEVRFVFDWDHSA